MSFQRDVSGPSYLEIISLLDNAIQSYTSGSADAQSCADSVICQLMKDNTNGVSINEDGLTIGNFLNKRLR